MAIEVNKVLYPGQPTVPVFDTTVNFPSIKENSAVAEFVEAINRNRDLLITLERILGPNPHIGTFTEDTQFTVATIDQRLDILENGLASGRFVLQEINVNNALVVKQDANDNIVVEIGGPEGAVAVSDAIVRGSMLFDSSAASAELRVKIPFIVERTKTSALSTNGQISGTSNATQPLLTITDFNTDPAIAPENRLALDLVGNLRVRGNLIIDQLGIQHKNLEGIKTTPSIDPITNQAEPNVIHVARGDYHAHKKGVFDEALGRYIVDPNPDDLTTGIIDHNDLDNVSPKPGVARFEPDPETAYHVTGGDEHDHLNGRGAILLHSYLDARSIDPKLSNHVTGGDNHAHANGAGAQIDHNNLANKGIRTHAEIDSVLDALPAVSNPIPVQKLFMEIGKSAATTLSSNSIFIHSGLSTSLVSPASGASIATATVSANIVISAGTEGKNGLDTGTSLVANAWYHVYLISDSIGAEVAGLLSLSATAPNLPDGFTTLKRLGAVRTDGAGDLRISYNKNGTTNYLDAVDISGIPDIEDMWVNDGGGTYESTWNTLSLSTAVPPTSTRVTYNIYGDAITVASPTSVVFAAHPDRLLVDATVPAIGGKVILRNVVAAGGHTHSAPFSGDIIAETNSNQQILLRAENQDTEGAIVDTVAMSNSDRLSVEITSYTELL